MNSLDKQTETTRIRISALENIHEKYACLNTVLWLRDRSTGSEEFLSSYHVGNDAAFRRKLIGQAIASPSEVLDEAAHFSAEVETIFNSVFRPDQKITHIALHSSGAPSSPDDVRRLNGFVTLHHVSGISDAQIAEISISISHMVEFTRLNRLATCVTNAQTFLSQTSKEIPAFLNQIGFFMLGQLNANRYMYVNMNKADHWLDVKGTTLTDLQNRPAAGDFAIDEISVSEPSHIRPVNLRFLGDDTPTAAVIVPVLQAGFKMDPVSFAKHNEFTRSLEPLATDDINLLFFEKGVSGYLQNRFSESDIAICNAVFGFIGKYIESRIFDHNANEVINYLDTENTIQDDAHSILSMLENLSHKFKSVTILKVSRFEQRIHFDRMAATAEISGLDRYLGKIRETDFRAFYDEQAGNHHSHPYFGIDRIDEDLYIEVHFPRYNGESRLYLMKFKSEIISESVLRSFINLFSDLHSRVMREENIRERGDYLVQVRHAVIHHFAAANRSIKSIRPLWERGQKDKEYWIDLLRDPLVGSDLARTISSLAQANLIIDNGRFMIGELDAAKLNRKPYRIIELINSTLDVLKHNREEKKIKPISKITGSPPKSMRGDGPLLSIVLINLFDNAIKYSPHFARMRWRLDYFNDRYRLSISSVGDMLDPKAKHVLFQVGYRGFQSDRLNRRHGTGLGLPVAYKILRTHSPTAQLSFEPFEWDTELEGAGNTFFFEMPYFSGSDARAAAENDLED